jgi:hypothetical protein
VPLILHSPWRCTDPQPVTVGVPFPKGALAGADALTLRAPDGRAVPLQTEALARWSEGSVKWLLLDFVAPGCPAGESEWRLEPARQEGSVLPSPTLWVEESADAIRVHTGAAVFELGRASLGPLRRVLLGGIDVLAAGSCRTLLTDLRGRPVPVRVEQAAVETRGPVRATVKLAGAFGGRVPCRFVARCCFFAGTGLVRLRLTIHNPRRARHSGGLWDLGDPGSVFFRGLAVELALRESAPRLAWRAEPGQTLRTAAGGSLEIYQDSSGGENWQSRNHVNRHGQVPCHFRGYRVRADGWEEAGLRANPTVVLRGDKATLTAAVPEFWQQFPKAVEVEDQRVRLSLFPTQHSDLFELQGGEQKSHTAWLHFGTAGDGEALAWVHGPACARATLAWYADSGAVVPLSLGADDRLDGLLAEAVAGPDSLFARREVIDEYGWRHYGDLYADHEAACSRGPQPVISHYNNQYDVLFGALVQFYRTGDRRWCELAGPLARHVIDIDIYHTAEDRPAYNGGLFWHTDHYRDAATATHRSYSRANRPADGRPYGGGPGNEHNYTTGLLHEYYRTGDPQAREAVLSLAGWVLAGDDGRRSPLAFADDGPTGLASATFQPDYHGPGRGCGNSVNALLDAWLLTGQAAYLRKAEALIRRSVHPADDIAAHDLLNVEKRWSYTVFLAALARYLDLKAEAGQLDADYAYARASLLHYARWMLTHERPYFDRPEQLEYPTETWAAQELRKANVFRLAARHADEPLASALRRAGDAFAERAWADLARFESRAVTRALAIVMTEGVRDAEFRAGPVSPAPRPAGEHDFGRPERFVPQKQRVAAKLRTVRGVLQIALQLANVRRWPRLLAAFGM